VLAADAAEGRIVAQQVGELAPLLHEVAAREARDLDLEIRGADDLAQHQPGVVEAQRLVEVAGDEVMMTPSATRHIHSLAKPDEQATR